MLKLPFFNYFFGSGNIITIPQHRWKGDCILKLYLMVSCLCVCAPAYAILTRMSILGVKWGHFGLQMYSELHLFGNKVATKFPIKWKWWEEYRRPYGTNANCKYFYFTLAICGKCIPFFKANLTVSLLLNVVFLFMSSFVHVYLLNKSDYNKVEVIQSGTSELALHASDPTILENGTSCPRSPHSHPTITPPGWRHKRASSGRYIFQSPREDGGTLRRHGRLKTLKTSQLEKRPPRHSSSERCPSEASHSFVVIAILF